jgi:very-short-patch-repair endonuclease
MINTRRYNNFATKEKRRALRKDQTDAERKIWQMLCCKQINGLKFFRQYGVENFILDFYCPKLKLAIEIDGGQHATNSDYDNRRTRELNMFKITVIRFWNNEVLQNPDGVYEKILLMVNNITPPFLPLS